MVDDSPGIHYRPAETLRSKVPRRRDRSRTFERSAWHRLDPGLGFDQPEGTKVVRASFGEPDQSCRTGAAWIVMSGS